MIQGGKRKKKRDPLASASRLLAGIRVVFHHAWQRFVSLTGEGWWLVGVLETHPKRLKKGRDVALQTSLHGFIIVKYK